MAIEEFSQKGFATAKLAGTSEAGDDGEESVVSVGEIGVEFAGKVEYLKGEVEVLLACDDGDEAFGGEMFWPWFDGRGDFVRVWEGGERVRGYGRWR